MNPDERLLAVAGDDEGLLGEVSPGEASFCWSTSVVIMAL